jgi:hypothetical protein
MPDDKPPVNGGTSKDSGGQKIIARDGSMIQDATQISGDVLFQIFIGAPASLASSIRVREFKQLIEEREERRRVTGTKKKRLIEKTTNS